MTEPVEKLLVDATQAASMLSMSRSFFYSQCAAGKIGPQALRFGKKKLWRTDELRLWIQKNCPTRERWIQRGDTQ